MGDLVFIALFNYLTNTFLVGQMAPGYKRKLFFFLIEKQINESQWTEELKDSNGNYDENSLALWS